MATNSGQHESDLARSLGETIDRLMSLEVRRIGFMTGVIPALYAAARQMTGGPLAWTAAGSLLDGLADADVVLIVTGHVHPVVMPHGETDGPLGAAALARLIDNAADVHPIVLCDGPVVEVMRDTVRAAGLLPMSEVPAAGERGRRATVLPLSTSAATARAEVEAIASRLRIGAVVTIEKIGPNRQGVMHSGLGNDLTAWLGRGDQAVEVARAHGVPTIGIGDLGNEIGFGGIIDAVERHVPYGATCQCGCGGGTASVLATDHLLVAGTSNWGAYALAAATAARMGHADLLHDGDDELAMLEAARRAGAVDGLSNGPTREVDGIPAAFHARWVDLLRDAARIGTDDRVSSRVAFEAGGVIAEPAG